MIWIKWRAQTMGDVGPSKTTTVRRLFSGSGMIAACTDKCAGRGGYRAAKRGSARTGASQGVGLRQPLPPGRRPVSRLPLREVKTANPSTST